MPTVADYVTFGDDSVTLEMGGDIDNTYTVTLPNNLNRNSNAIMTFRRVIDQNPTNLEWSMSVNGTQLFSFTAITSNYGSVQEVFSGSLLNVGPNNVEVTVRNGTGRLRVSDFALHYKVDV